MKPNTHVKKHHPKFKLGNFIQKWIQTGIDLLIQPEKLGVVTILILVIELVLNIFVIQKVNYTEIDWIAYMQECEGFLNGTLDYGQLKGRFQFHKTLLISFHCVIRPWHG